jgi:5-methylcytosine-specific restriction protein A
MARLSRLPSRLRMLDSRLLRAPSAESDQTANQRYNAQRRRDSETARLYSTRRWQALRAEQLSREPLCCMCMAEGRVTSAVVCDHVEPHRGDVAKFWFGPFQSLCKRHHDSDKQRDERA